MATVSWNLLTSRLHVDDGVNRQVGWYVAFVAGDGYMEEICIMLYICLLYTSDAADE